MSKRLTTEVPKSSSLIRVGYRSTDPNKAALIVNTVIEVYLDQQVKAKQEAISGTIGQLRDRLDSLRHQVEIADQVVQSFRNKHDLLKTSGVPALIQHLNELTSSGVRTETEAADATARLRLLRSLGPNSLATLPASTSTDVQLIRELKLHETDLRTRLTAALTKLGESHPTVVDLKAQANKIEARLNDEFNRMVAGIGRDAAVLNERRERISQEIEGTRNQIKRENELDSELDRLVGEAKSKRAAYDAAVAGYNRVLLLASSQVPDIRVVYRAEPPVKPSFPRPLLLALTSLVSVIAGAGLVLIFHPFGKSRSETAREFEQRYNVPVLGLTPQVESFSRSENPRSYFDRHPLSEYEESVRGIRNAVDLANADNARSVAIVSALAGEGKSTLALSLAIVWARSGLRTLLIDCDTRRSEPPLLFHDKRRDGLTGYPSHGLAESGLIQSSPQIAFQSGGVLLGARLKDPNYQFSEKEFRKLLQSVLDRYDRIMFDMPPLLAVADSAVGAATADLVILVTRWGHTASEATQSAIECLRKLRSSGIAAVLCRVNLEKYAKLEETDQYSFYKQKRDYYTAR